MDILQQVIDEYNKESLNEDPTYENINHDEVQEYNLVHVPGTEVYVLSTSCSPMYESEILQIHNLKNIGEHNFNVGENYVLTTDMYTKIDASKKAGILISGTNAEGSETFIFFSA